MGNQYKGKKAMATEQLIIYDRSFRLQFEGKPPEHIMAYAKALNLKPHIALYHAHRLQVRGLVKLVKVGNMTFIHVIPPKMPEV